jgi:glycosyltransferase involved in cell wall biosynthesis
VKVALVHDWLTGMRGGEKVLDAICELFPDAPLFTLLYVKGSVSPRIEARPITASLVQSLPGASRFYRHLLPLYPWLVEGFDLDGFDLVISSSHCAVKSVIAPRAVHVCYCHSPMRYAWDQFPEYFGSSQVGAAASRILRPVMASLARWDASTAARPDRFLANSQYVAGRIGRYYNRRSAVVYPPVDTDYYRPSGDVPAPSAPNFVVVSALVPYKRVDLAVAACRKAGVRLRVAGRGPELERLQHLGGTDVEFLGWRSDDEIRQLYREASAVLLPGVEDFGMVPVEAQACGIPVVALDAGGARETVVDGRTGVLVGNRSVDAFAAGLTRALQTKFDKDAIRQNALRFSRDRFLSEFQQAVDGALAARPHEAAPSVTHDRSAARLPFASNSAPSDESAARWPPGGYSAPRENKK